MNATPASTGDQDEAGLYEIRLKGHLDDKWADWFDGLTITRADNGETLFRGPVVDQAALHGVLGKCVISACHCSRSFRWNANRRTGRMATRARIIIVRTRRQTHEHQESHPLGRSLSDGGRDLFRGGSGCSTRRIFFRQSSTSRWVIVHAVAIAMSLFGLLGITGLYARQAHAAGWLGLAGYLLFSLWLVLVLAFTFFEVFILPLLATKAPTFAAGFLGIFTGSAAEMNFGVLAALWGLSDTLFLLGGLVFGIATFRAGILSRWAARRAYHRDCLAPAVCAAPERASAAGGGADRLRPRLAGLCALVGTARAASEAVPGRASPQLGHTGAE